MAHSDLPRMSVWARTRRARHIFSYLVVDHTNSSRSLLLFGADLRELRLKRNFSQRRLAELAGLREGYIGMVERGECNISLTAIVALARALNVKPAKLMAAIR